MDISIRQIRPQSGRDIDQFRELYHLSFGCEYPEDVWRWKYLKNPLCPGDPLIFVAEVENKIVGTCSLLPSLAKFYRWNIVTIVKACQFNNIMVKSSYRRKGIFTQLIRCQQEQAKARGFQLEYEYPNKLSIGGFLKTGRTLVGRIISYKNILVIPDSLVRNYLVNKRIPAFTHNLFVPLAQHSLSSLHPPKIISSFIFKKGPLNDFAPDIEKLNADHIPADGMYGYRGQDFLRWRYNRPDREYYTFTLYDGNVLIAYLIIASTHSSKFAIMKDVFAINYDRDLIGALVWQTRQFLKERSYESFMCDMLDRQWPYKNLFSRYRGFRKSKGEYFVMKLIDNSLDQDFLANKNHWFFQQVDNSPF